MSIIEIIYITFVGLSIAACIPQIRHLLKQKHSDEFEISTWVMWLSAQIATLAYVISLREYLLIAVNVAWVSFYLTMVCLIVYYRRYPGGRQLEPLSIQTSHVEVPVTAESTI